MVFKVGETVVYPHHGAALIEAIETRTIKGEERKYLVLKVAQGDLTVRVPAENAEVVGVRDVVGQEGLDRVFEVLRAPHTEEPTNWSRRYKANLEKLASGDVNKVAEVVRDLWRRDKDREQAREEAARVAVPPCQRLPGSGQRVTDLEHARKVQPHDEQEQGHVQQVLGIFPPPACLGSEYLLGLGPDRRLPLRRDGERVQLLVEREERRPLDEL